MRKNWTVWGASALILGAALACGPKEEAVDTAAQDAEWAALQQAEQALDARRAELAALEAEAAAEGAAADVATMTAEVLQATDDFNGRLVTFINDNAPIQGEPPTERQQAALRMKSDEDILIAQEYIEDGGDYRGAIKIYNAALQADPAYDRLKQLLAEAEGMRFMNPERFAQAKKGMDEAQVRAALGPVNQRNIRPFEAQKVTAWYYPKDEAGSAAAVWFHTDRSGKLVVYKLEYDAVKAGEG